VAYYLGLYNAMLRLRHRRCGLERAAKLALGVTSRRVRYATERDYLVNRETRRGLPARIILGAMPEMVKLLPEPGEFGHDREDAPL
jgi:hypothetical protein